ncbi:hypothetical protein SAMN05216249_107137 [Acetitomaculum ruminis DSM 5522]|uniref:Tetratricopeptide repeat-containing protein n=1 Tax=Acetitomaculum ruminis DSM 5522 TaxID=1120918 RepID=A0A1I0XSY2_9FIRM|nr:hypothetical protein [Acetitomaculum ruminis]SFB04165.1 hypothetical protein SAMN05216249_107137 [Acetitomaculum ruminis DSM 5522]
MGKVLVCNSVIAKTPYYIKEAGIKIFTIEELSYFISQNAYLLDESFMNVELCNFIKNELGMEELGNTLRELIRKQGKVAEFAAEIVYSNNFFNEEEKRKIRDILLKISSKNVFFRRKAKADEMFNRNQYINSIIEYNKLLEGEKDRTVSNEEYGNAYHNLASAYARLFLFGQAARYYKIGYSYNKSQETFKEYLFSLRFYKDDIFGEDGVFFDKKITPKDAAELEVYLENMMDEEGAKENIKKVKELMDSRDEGDFGKYYTELRKMLEQRKKEYTPF